MRSVPGIPLVYINRSVMIMEPPSAATMEFVKKVEQKKAAPEEFEVVAVKKEGEDGTENASKRKRKRKDPNPLSCKKKKKAQSQTQQQSEDAGAKKKRKRSRKAGTDCQVGTTMTEETSVSPPIE